MTGCQICVFCSGLHFSFCFRTRGLEVEHFVPDLHPHHALNDYLTGIRGFSHNYLCHTVTTLSIHSFIHSGHFYSAPSSPLLLRGAPDYSTDTVSEFHAEAHRQLQVKDLPKVPTWRLERESNPRPSG